MPSLLNSVVSNGIGLCIDSDLLFIDEGVSFDDIVSSIIKVTDAAAKWSTDV